MKGSMTVTTTSRALSPLPPLPLLSNSAFEWFPSFWQVEPGVEGTECELLRPDQHPPPVSKGKQTPHMDSRTCSPLPPLTAPSAKTGTSSIATATSPLVLPPLPPPPPPPPPPRSSTKRTVHPPSSPCYVHTHTYNVHNYIPKKKANEDLDKHSNTKKNARSDNTVQLVDHLSRLSLSHIVSPDVSVTSSIGSASSSSMNSAISSKSSSSSLSAPVAGTQSLAPLFSATIATTTTTSSTTNSMPQGSRTAAAATIITTEPSPNVRLRKRQRHSAHSSGSSSYYHNKALDNKDFQGMFAALFSDLDPASIGVRGTDTGKSTTATTMGSSQRENDTNAADLAKKKNNISNLRMSFTANKDGRCASVKALGKEEKEAKR